jgi:hypothetical protein
MNNFEGSKYQETKNLAHKEIAKLIKKEVQSAHPEIELSVTSPHYHEIRIIIKKTPFKIIRKVCHLPEYANKPANEIPKWCWDYVDTEEAEKLKADVQMIANQYRFDDSDLMTDYFSTNFYAFTEFDCSIREPELKAMGAI